MLRGERFAMTSPLLLILPPLTCRGLLLSNVAVITQVFLPCMWEAHVFQARGCFLHHCSWWHVDDIIANVLCNDFITDSACILSILMASISYRNWCRLEFANFLEAWKSYLAYSFEIFFCRMWKLWSSKRNDIILSVFFTFMISATQIRYSSAIRWPANV